MSERLIVGIDFAISLEEKGLVFYRRCFKSVRRNEAKELFSFLIKAEEAHKESLEIVKKGVLANNPDIIKKGVDKLLKLKIPVPLFKDKDFEYLTKSSTSLREMLNKSMEFEKEGMGFYTGMALKEDEPLLKAFWKRLGRDELFHKQEIERLGFMMLGIPKWEVA